MQWLPLSLLALPDFHEKSRDGGTFTLHSTTTVAPVGTVGTVPQQLVQLDAVLGKCWTQWKDCTQSEAENVFGGKTIVNACPPSKAGVEDTPKDSYIQYSPPAELPCIVFICVCVGLQLHMHLCTHTYWQLERSSCEHVPDPSPGESGETVPPTQFHNSSTKAAQHSTFSFLRGGHFLK